MNTKQMIILALAACPLAAGAEPARQTAAGRPKMRDVVTHEQLSARRGRVAPDPMLGLKQEDPIKATVVQEGAAKEGAAKGEEWKPTSLLARSEFLSFRGTATMVPKGAVLNVPANLVARVKLDGECRIVNWREFFIRNRAWIKTIEVSRGQAEGTDPLSEETLKSIQESSSVVIATMRGGPISVLRPKPPVDPQLETAKTEPKS